MWALPTRRGPDGDRGLDSEDRAISALLRSDFAQSTLGQLPNGDLTDSFVSATNGPLSTGEAPSCSTSPPAASRTERCAMRDRHVPRLCRECQSPMARQDATCWRCGARWAIEERPRPHLRVVGEGRPVPTPPQRQVAAGTGS